MIWGGELKCRQAISQITEENHETGGVQGCIKWGNENHKSCLQGLPVQLRREVEDSGIHEGPPGGLQRAVLGPWGVLWL